MCWFYLHRWFPFFLHSRLQSILSFSHLNNLRPKLYDEAITMWCVIITFVIFVPIWPPPPYQTFLESDNLFSNFMDHFICTFLYLVFFFLSIFALYCFFWNLLLQIPFVLILLLFCYCSTGLPFLQIVVQDHFFTNCQSFVTSDHLFWNCCIRTSSWILFADYL